MVHRDNLSIGLTRAVAGNTGFSHVFASRNIMQHHSVSSPEVNYLLPLYLYPDVGRSGELLLSPWPAGKDGRRPNLDPGFVERSAQANGLQFISDGRGDLLANFGPEDLLAYIYAVFHSPVYRDRYDAHFKLDFPRVPPRASVGLLRELARAGHSLVALLTLASPRRDHPVTNYAGPKNLEVSRVGGRLTANTPAVDPVSRTGAARSATPAVGLDLAGSCRESGKTGREWREPDS